MLNAMNSILRLTWLYGPREIRLAKLLLFDRVLGVVQLSIRSEPNH